jgi:hypothetical protein
LVVADQQMKLIAFLVQSRIWVALAAAGLTYQCYGLFGEWVRVTMVMHVFFLTWTAYLFLDSQFIGQRKWMFHASLIGLFVTWQGGETLWLSGLAALAVLTYRLHWLDIFPTLQRYELRRVPLLNNALIALCWITICYVLPLSIAQVPFHRMASFVVGDFCWIMALSLCEDLMQDEETPDATLHAFGEKGLRLIAALLIVTGAFFRESSARDVMASHATSLAALTLVVVMKAGPRHPIKSLLVDGVILLRMLS